MKLDDEIVELKEWDAVARPARYVARLRGRAGGSRDSRHRARPISVDAPREDVDGRRDWWAD